MEEKNKLMLQEYFQIIRANEKQIEDLRRQNSKQEKKLNESAHEINKASEYIDKLKSDVYIF